MTFISRIANTLRWICFVILTFVICIFLSKLSSGIACVHVLCVCAPSKAAMVLFAANIIEGEATHSQAGRVNNRVLTRRKTKKTATWRTSKPGHSNFKTRNKTKTLGDKNTTVRIRECQELQEKDSSARTRLKNYHQIRGRELESGTEELGPDTRRTSKH